MPITAKGHKMLAAHMGLNPETNNDDDVAEVIRTAATKKDIDDLKNRAKAGDDALGALVDADLAKYANRIGTDKEVIASWKEDLLKNRAPTIKKLEAIPAPVAVEAKKPLHNRSTAGQPTILQVEESQAEVKRATLISNRAVAIKNEQGLKSLALAFDLAEQEFDAKQ